jgi:energy-coupling factor transport system substrate-specific component
MARRLFTGAIYGLSAGVGILAFVYPFLLPAIQTASRESARATDTPLLLTVIVGLCFVAVLLEVQGQAISARMVALLGVLVSINALLRYLELAIPGPAGFSPIFLLIILVGYVYGGRSGFLMGALTMIVSALITGGIGPWLPYQMIAAGWVGLTATLCGPLVRLIGGEGKRRERLVLMSFGALWGFGYGAMMNLWFWPFMQGAAGQSWTPGMSLTTTLQNYAAFYLVTSFAWDIASAIGNALLILVFGAPVIRALRRFHQRFVFHYEAAGGHAEAAH